jgi:YesN/AraC family two-component response regulator
VDDEPAVLAALQIRMRKYLAGCDVSWTTSGEAALQEFKMRPFDVVVTDLRMPGMDGVSLLRAVKRASPAARRIVLSGHDLSGPFDLADCVLHKPCPPEVLRDAVLGAA